MSDPRFFKNSGPFSLKDLCEISGAELIGSIDQDALITDVQPLDIAGAGHISFLSNPKYVDQFKSSAAGACILHKQYVADAPESVALLVAEDPYKAYARISGHFYPEPLSNGKIHPTASVSETAALGNNVSIGAFTVVEDGVEIGANTIVNAHCTLEENVIVGENCTIHSNVSLKKSHVGNYTTVHSGARIGNDGFGFAPDPSGHIKIPQLGRVLIGSGCEIGANTAVDRGSGPDTIIGDGCWIDNLCQIAHNVQMGRGCILAAQSGISGSTILEDFVVLGGQAGLAGHITIGMAAQITARSGVISNVPAGKVYAGFPAQPRKEFFRNIATLNKISKTKRTK
jgi:UDP-3-O-[3-hydroxymyristoyl] glucosamine N-acyltransferase